MKWTKSMRKNQLINKQCLAGSILAKFFIAFFALLGLLSSASAADKLQGLVIGSQLYYIRFVSGDVVSGTVLEYVHSDEFGEGIRFATELGTARVFESQVLEILPDYEFYKHSHRVFLLPTAEPIGSNHFIGSFELLFLYGGFGVGDVLSVTAGRSIVPSLRSSEQINELNAKLTFLSVSTEDSTNNRIVMAAGANYATLNDDNKLLYFYGVATAKLSKTNFSALVFYNASPNPITSIRFGENLYNMNYANRGFGIGLGLDTKLAGRNDVRVIGEIWNSDITRAYHTLALLGIRLFGTQFSADFGLAFSTYPFAAPFASFVWTPF